MWKINFNTFPSAFSQLAYQAGFKSWIRFVKTVKSSSYYGRKTSEKNADIRDEIVFLEIADFELNH